jgi:CBS domain containing-hemolysin-like protein
MYTVLNIIIVFLLVFANGFFVAAEFALVGVRRSRIETLAAGGSRSAKRLLNILDNMNAYLSAAQLGITLASLALGWIGEPAVARVLEGPLAGRVSETVLHTLAFAIAFSIITTLHIVLGEQAPKLLGLERAERVALATALPLQIFHKVFRLPIRALDWASARTVSLLGLHYTGGHGSIYTEEELRQLVNASQKSGMLEESERLLINRVFDFAEAEVREAMVPRMSVIALPLTATLEEAEKTFCEMGYSRLPVYAERLDNITGVLFMKDLMQCMRQPSSEFKIESHLHPPMFIPATARLGSVLAQMQAAQTHLAFVIDEHGGIEGIVTMEDLLEEIVGEINDEYDEEVRAQIVEDNGTYILDGMLAVRDANRRFNLRLPEDAGFTTLAGFMLAQAGRLLRPGEVVEYERVERRRIRRIRFVPAAESEEEAIA